VGVAVVVGETEMVGVGVAGTHGSSYWNVLVAEHWVSTFVTLTCKDPSGTG
jgi:hypothetical protein